MIPTPVRLMVVHYKDNCSSVAIVNTYGASIGNTGPYAAGGPSLHAW